MNPIKTTITLWIFLFTFLFFSLSADESKQPVDKEQTSESETDEHPTYAFEFRYSPYDRDNTDVHGLKLGIPMSSGLGIVEGAELSLLGCDTANIIGFQGSFFVNITHDLDGMQMGFANMIREKAQWGQLGVVCFVAKKMEGFQASLFNYSRITEGVQIGIINYAEDIATFQLGLLCYNKESWVPMLPFVNFDPDLFESDYEYDYEYEHEDQEGKSVKEAESEITPDTSSDTSREVNSASWYDFMSIF